MVTRSVGELTPDTPALGIRALVVAFAFNALAGVAAAQSSGAGSTICGTAIADGATQTARLVIGLLVLGCIVVAGLAEGYGRLKRAPQEKAEVMEWRNGAAMGAITTPVIMWLVIQVAGFFNIPVVSCVDLVPFI